MSLAEPEVLERLHRSRDEIRDLLQPLRERHDAEFPRSGTMRLLLGKTGSGLAGAMIGAALLRVSPRAGKLLSLLPLSAVASAIFRWHGSSRRNHGDQ